MYIIIFVKFDLSVWVQPPWVRGCILTRVCACRYVQVSVPCTCEQHMHVALNLLMSGQQAMYILQLLIKLKFRYKIKCMSFAGVVRRYYVGVICRYAPPFSTLRICFIGRPFQNLSDARTRLPRTRWVETLLWRVLYMWHAACCVCLFSTF